MNPEPANGPGHGDVRWLDADEQRNATAGCSDDEEYAAGHCTTRDSPVPRCPTASVRWRWHPVDRLDLGSSQKARDGAR